MLHIHGAYFWVNKLFQVIELGSMRAGLFVCLFVCLRKLEAGWAYQDIKGEINASPSITQELFNTITRNETTRFHSPNQKAWTLEMRDKVKWYASSREEFPKINFILVVVPDGLILVLPTVWCNSYPPHSKTNKSQLGQSDDLPMIK